MQQSRIKIFGSLVVLMFILTGCSLGLQRPQVFENSPFPREDVVLAIDNFVDIWGEAHYVNVNHLFEGIHIEFYEKSMEEWEEGCVSGSTSDTQSIRVGHVVNSGAEWQLNQTAIWHEFTHLTFWNEVGDPDRDHAEGDGPWTEGHNNLIRELKLDWAEILKERER